MDGSVLLQDRINGGVRAGRRRLRNSDPSLSPLLMSTNHLPSGPQSQYQQQELTEQQLEDAVRRWAVEHNVMRKEEADHLSWLPFARLAKGIYIRMDGHEQPEILPDSLDLGKDTLLFAHGRHHDDEPMESLLPQWLVFDSNFQLKLEDGLRAMVGGGMNTHRWSDMIHWVGGRVHYFDGMMGLQYGCEWKRSVKCTDVSSVRVHGGKQLR